MSDRDSAEIFRYFFVQMAKAVEYERKRNVDLAQTLLADMAREAWMETFKYDFSHYQLECDDELLTLGLARRNKDEIEYLTRDGKGWK